MEFQIMTFGNGEILKGVFDAIAICLNSESGTLYVPLIRISLILGGLWAALYAIYGDYMRAITGWLIPATAIMQLLFVPQATVWINDPVSRYHQKVDHVPLGLALIAGRVSEFGFHFTRQVERVFSLPDDLKYQKSGALFAGQLLQQARTFRITNEDLTENMRNFVGHCVAYDALLGRKYSIDDLRNSDDIWALVSNNASPVRSFLWRNLKPEGGERASPEIITCREGVGRFNQNWPAVLNNTATIFGQKIFGNYGVVNAKAEILQYLPLAYSTLTNLSKSAEQILQQNMMIYAVVDGLEYKSTQVGNAPNFAVRKAYLQQRATYETIGAMAAETLPSIKAVIEAIAYAAFLFVIPFACLPFGYTFLKTWFQVLLWLQMWAPLYAVLNYIMTMAARSKCIAALSISNQAGVTIASSIGLSNVNADMAAMAGYLAMSIPFLCIAMVKGLGSIANIPALLSSISSSSATQAAAELSSGNYNIGNIMHGTRQAYNTNALTTNYAASYRAGSFQQADGHVEMTTTADGTQIINMSRSSLGVSLNVAENQSSQLTAQAGHSYQKGMQQSESYLKNATDSLSQMVNLSDHISSAQQAGNTFAQNEAIDQSSALSKTSQTVKDFAKENNLTTEQSAGVMMAASIGGAKGLSLLSALGLNFELEASTSGDANLQNIYGKAEKVSQSEEFQTSLRESLENTRQQSFNTQDETGKRLSEGVTRAWDEANSARLDATKSFSESEHYQTQAQRIKSSSATINAEHLQSALEWYAGRKMDNTNGNVGMREAARVFVSEPVLRNKILESYMEVHGLLPPSPAQLNTLSPDNLRASYSQDNSHKFMDVNKDTANSQMNALRDKAKEQGITGAGANHLEQAFNQAQGQAKSTISQGEQQVSQQYKDADKQHQLQTQKSLIDLADGQAIERGKDLLPQDLFKTPEKEEQ